MVGISNDELLTLLSYLNKAIKEGRLTSPNQMTKSNLKKVVEKFIPRSQTSSKDIGRFISELCDMHAGGRGITIGNKKEITNKVVKYFTENTHLEVNEKAVRGRILFYKTSYTNHGMLDQRYQN